MDTSKTYIKMCEKAWEIQIAKFEGEGLVAGDCIWNGSQHLWLANDFFGLYGLWENKIPYAYIACMEETTPVAFTQEKLFGTVTMRKEKYVLKRLAGFGIWLPRQDQLQEMVPTNLGSSKPNFKMISELNHFFDYWDTEGIPNYLTTWEQLWFGFVMKENCNKVWTGEDWVKDIK